MMRRIIERWTFDERFEAQVIHEDDHQWIRLSSLRPARLLTFWSSKGGAAWSVDRVLDELKQRLAAPAKDTLSVLDAIEWWPEGWDYWGAGVPQPLLDYLTSTEYENEVVAFPARAR